MWSIQFPEQLYDCTGGWRTSGHAFFCARAATADSNAFHAFALVALTDGNAVIDGYPLFPRDVQRPDEGREARGARAVRMDISREIFDDSGNSRIFRCSRRCIELDNIFFGYR